MLGVKGSRNVSGRTSPSCCTVSPPSPDSAGAGSADRHSQCAPIVLVEGNIGAGKTTLIRELAEQLGYRVFLEPTAKNPYLSKFYADPKKYALKLQLWIFRQRFLIYVAAVKHVLEKGQGVLLDRSVFSDCVFADVGYEDGNITEEGFQFYNQLRHLCLSKVPVPNFVVYLDASPETCRSRILKRGRECEVGIPVSYLASLHGAYQPFLSKMKKCGSEVLKLDWESFGSASSIAAAVRQVRTDWSCSPNIADLREFVSNGMSVNALISLPRHLQDDDDKENSPMGADKLQETEELSHQQEKAKAQVLGESKSAGNSMAHHRIGSMVAASVSAY